MKLCELWRHVWGVSAAPDDNAWKDREEEGRTNTAEQINTHSHVVFVVTLSFKGKIHPEGLWRSKSASKKAFFEPEWKDAFIERSLCWCFVAESNCQTATSSQWMTTDVCSIKKKIKRFGHDLPIKPTLLSSCRCTSWYTGLPVKCLQNKWMKFYLMCVTDKEDSSLRALSHL